jgi:hypothetical protein
MSKKPKIQTIMKPKGKIVDYEEKAEALYLYFESREAAQEWFNFIKKMSREEIK